MRQSRNQNPWCDFFVSSIYASRVDAADKETIGEQFGFLREACGPAKVLPRSVAVFTFAGIEG
jgi:hypothetical protein